MTSDINDQERDVTKASRKRRDRDSYKLAYHATALRGNATGENLALSASSASAPVTVRTKRYPLTRYLL